MAHWPPSPWRTSLTKLPRAVVRLHHQRAPPVRVDSFIGYLKEQQERMIKEAERLDSSGTSFRRDHWERSTESSTANSSAGHGLTAVLEGGAVLEKAAINSTFIRGKLTAGRAKAITARGTGVSEGQEYTASALSLVFHPANPHLPTLRADVRQFQVAGDTWYGGGCDLTPAYLYPDDACAFHGYWKELCARFDRQLYARLKSACDAYFYLPARKEHRGIGGIFFDDLRSSAELDAEQFTRDVLASILPSWMGIAGRRCQQPFTIPQRQWQLQRRGRYIEFNLLYDRGVKFGLEGGRVESVMVSAPPLVAWAYDVHPLPGSQEAELVQVLQSPADWA